MERGFYHNKDNEIVFCGNRKPKNSGGLTWINGHEKDWPKKLRESGFYTSFFKDGAIIENQACNDAVRIEKTRKDDIKAAQYYGGLQNASPKHAKEKIVELFEGANTIVLLREATIKALEMIAVYSLK